MAGTQLRDEPLMTTRYVLTGRVVTVDGAWHAIAPPTNVVSTVGAGDSSLFGYLLGDVRGGSPIERLALGVAYGSAAVGLAGTTVPKPSQTHPDLVTVRPLNHSPGATT